MRACWIAELGLYRPDSNEVAERNGPSINALAGAQSPDYAASMAGALIASLPTLVVYIVLGRWFIGGLMAGSVKS